MRVLKHNLQILLQGRQDNPIHEVAFNELIENLKERNTIWSNMNGAKIRSAVQHSMENRKAVNFYRYIYIAYISKI